jgi:hypothetical protein
MPRVAKCILKTKTFSSILKNALAYYNGVCSCKFKSRRIGSWRPFKFSPFLFLTLTRTMNVKSIVRNFLRTFIRCSYIGLYNLRILGKKLQINLYLYLQSLLSILNKMVYKQGRVWSLIRNVKTKQWMTLRKLPCNF